MCPQACLISRIGTSIIEAQTSKYFLFKWDMCHVEKDGNLAPPNPLLPQEQIRESSTFESLKRVVASRFLDKLSDNYFLANVFNRCADLAGSLHTREQKQLHNR